MLGKIPNLTMCSFDYSRVAVCAGDPRFDDVHHRRTFQGKMRAKKTNKHSGTHRVWTSAENKKFDVIQQASATARGKIQGDKENITPNTSVEEDGGPAKRRRKSSDMHIVGQPLEPAMCRRS